MESTIVRVTFGDKPHCVGLAINHEVTAPSLSGIYVRLHLPSDQNPSKVVVQVGLSSVPVQVELRYDRGDGSGLAEVDLTAGASVYPFVVSCLVDGDGLPPVGGSTGVTAALVLPLR